MLSGYKFGKNVYYKGELKVELLQTKNTDLIGYAKKSDPIETLVKDINDKDGF